MAATSRRVSYILPSPNDPPPLLTLPKLGQARRGQTSPLFQTKPSPSPSGNGPTTPFQSKNPFLSAASPPPDAPSTIQENHPRHCLGLTSLAIDTSTLLSNQQSPGGILYSGGRDGLIASWELNIPHRRRRGGRYELPPGRGNRVKWERIGDGAEFWDEEDEDDGFEESDEILSSEDEFNDEGGLGGGRRRSSKGEVPYEDRWEVDKSAITDSKPQTAFRQSAQIHTDWVNAMLLCNLNQTVITASSDRTIRAWNPHAEGEARLSPALVGRHRDYVKALAWARHPSLLFSGALDRYLSVWDISSPKPDTPIFSIDLSKITDYEGVGMDGDRGSVYALGVDPAGKVLAAGTPERVVRLWDPRAGDQSIGKLIGHSDCVRSIVLSEDGRYILTGSSDSTIKLWSLAAHRCLHTFNHHDSSVWALHSTHPNLERFYSGSRDGYVCVTDVEQCADISEGECVVLARDADPNVAPTYESKSGDEGIRSIVALDDEYVWTANGSADIKRWKDVGRRIHRSNADQEGSSYGDRSAAATGGSLGLALQPSPTTQTGNRQSAFDGAPVEQQGLLGDGQNRSIAFAPDPRGNGLLNDYNTSPTSRLAAPGTRRTNYASSFMSDSSAGGDDTGRAGSAQADSLNGIPYASLVCLGLPDSPYSFGFSHHRSDEFAPPLDGAAPGPRSMLRPEDAHDDEQYPRRVSIQLDREPTQQLSKARRDFEDREVATDAKPLRSSADGTIAGRPGLVRSIMLNDRQHVLTVDTEGEVAAWNIIRGTCVGRFSAQDVAEALHLETGVKAETAVRKHSNEVLEMVKERVEGETMVITWCQVDTKIGSLVVHLEEGRVFDAEIYADELGYADPDGSNEDSRINLGKWTLANLFRGLIKAEEEIARASSPTTTSSSLPSQPQITIERSKDSPPHRKRAMSGTFTESTAISLRIPGLVSPSANAAVLPDIESPLSRSAPTTSAFQSFAAMRNGLSNGNGNSLSAIPQSPTSVPGSTPGEALGRADYFSSSSRRTDPSPDRAPTTPSNNTTAAHTASNSNVPGTPGGSFMGKLKGFGKKKQVETPMAPVIEIAPEPVEDNGPKFTEREQAQLTILDIVRSHPFNPPPAWEAPPIPFPGETSLLISEEAKDAGAWVVTYRSQVSSTERDMEALEMNSPLWLLDYLFTSRVKAKDPVKLTFILEPEPGTGLRRMPEGSTRLSASRVLRARKILHFIYDKLELGSRGRSGSIVSINSRIAPAGSAAARGASQAVGSANGPGSNNRDRDGLSGHEPEDVLELLCGPEIVDPKITLATLKHYYGSGGDMLLHYRLKEGVSLK